MAQKSCIIWYMKKEEKTSNWLSMYIEYTWKPVKEIEKQNWIDGAGVRVRLFSVYPVVFWILITNSKGFKNELREEWHHHLMCCLSILRSTRHQRKSEWCNNIPWFPSIKASPASLGICHPGECAHHRLNVDIHSGSRIKLLLQVASFLLKTSTPCQKLLLWEYSSPIGGGWSSSQSTESSSVSTTMWHSRSPFLAQPTMIGKISSSR